MISLIFSSDEQNVKIPSFGQYATGIFFLDKLHHQESEEKFTALAEEMDLAVLAWRTVPTDNSTIGTVAKNSEPFMRQVRHKKQLVNTYYIIIPSLFCSKCNSIAFVNSSCFSQIPTSYYCRFQFIL